MTDRAEEPGNSSGRGSRVDQSRRYIAMKPTSSGSSSGNGGREGSKRSTAPGNRKYASRACVNCRRRKRKCDGENCSACAKDGILCVMDFDSDQRRQINRNSRSVRDKMQDKLIAALRNTSITDAQLLLDAIRSESVPSQLEALVDELEPKAHGPDDTASIDDDDPSQLQRIDSAEVVNGWDPTPTDSEMSFAIDSRNGNDESGLWLQSSSSKPDHTVSYRDSGLNMYNSGFQSRTDQISQVILSFREAARSQLARGASAGLVLSMTGLELDLHFRDRLPSDPHTVSTWACQFVNSNSSLTPLLQLALIYFAGTFMRWMILPCQHTYSLMSKIMRPLAPDVMTHSSTDWSHCRDQGLIWLTSLMADEKSLLWPYGPTACISDQDPGPRRLSTLFMDHCDEIKHWEMLSTPDQMLSKQEPGTRPVNARFQVHGASVQDRGRPEKR